MQISAWEGIERNGGKNRTHLQEKGKQRAGIHGEIK